MQPPHRTHLDNARDLTYALTYLSRDFPSRSGGAVIGARLRRLSDRIGREADGLYSSFGIDFEQRWFGVMNQLALNGRMSAGELSEVLVVSHAAVSQTRAALMQRSLILTSDDPNDARRRMLALSAEGRKLAKKLAPLWAATVSVGVELDREAGNVINALTRLEAALDKRGLAERVRAAIETGRPLRKAARQT